MQLTDGTTVRKILIQDIAGIHPEIMYILRQSRAIDIPINTIPSIHYDDNFELLVKSPIVIHLYRKKYYVISNINAYRLMRRYPNRQIGLPSVVHNIKMSSFIRDIIRNELLITSAIHAGSYNPNYIYRIHKWMSNSKRYHGLRDVPLSKSGFAKWLNIDERNIK